MARQALDSLPYQGAHALQLAAGPEIRCNDSAIPASGLPMSSAVTVSTSRSEVCLVACAVAVPTAHTVDIADTDTLVNARHKDLLIFFPPPQYAVAVY